MASSPANRGKEAEKLLVAYFTKLSVSATTAFFRLPDARSGSLAPTLSDFILAHDGQPYLVECKQTEHDFRLPHGNFGVDQVARMRMFQLAGFKSLVLIYHSKIQLWRGYNVERFTKRELGTGSWDLRDTKPKTLESLMFGGNNAATDEKPGP